MSDTAANRMAGGPIVYWAATTSSLPAITGATVTWSNNEVQTITKDGTVSGGTATIEVVYPDATSETTAAIAYDADAAAIKSALAALSGLSASDLTVTGGPFSTDPVVITFGGTWANTSMGLCVVDDGSITGGGTLSCARTTAGRLWTEMPDVIKDVKVKYVHKETPHRPAFSSHPTGGTTIDIGVESIEFEIEESDLSAFNLCLASSLLAVTAPGAGQVGMETLTQPLAADADTAVVQLALNFKGPQGGTGWGIIDHYYRCKRIHDYTVSAGQGVRTIGIKFQVYALSSATPAYSCHKAYEYTAAATS
jgi:hypothetical protein